MDSLAFVHGAVHCLALSLNNSVVSFSISNEVYKEIKRDCAFVLDFKQSGVSILGRMLCGYSTYTHQRKDTL